MNLYALRIPVTGGILTKTCLPDRQAMRIMKITAVILLAACLQVSARSGAQNITISLKNASLEKVFLEIKKQAGYNFVYNNSLLKETKNVDINVVQATVEEVLQKCFLNQPLTYSIVNKTIIIKPKTESPNEEGSIEQPPPPIDVHGRVVNEKGEPVEGATVTVKGTKNATATDTNGEFTLKNVDENATLVFTSVNMEPFELKVNGKMSLLVNLKTKVATLANTTVEINTGYQLLPKERATGSFNFINSKTFNEQVGTSVLGRLEAIGNSVLVDRKTGNPGILIRGLSTIQGPKDPLIIVDNFPYDGDFNNINPNDVESITILKDAAAASVWGTKAGNGVIVITTKKGKFNQPLSVEFNSNITIGDKSDLSYIKQISSSDLINTEIFLYSKGYYDNLFTNNSQPAISPVVEILKRRALGQITTGDSASQIDALRGLDIRNDFNNYFYKKSVNQQYAINLRGGSNNVSWIMSAGYDKNLTDLNAKYNRLNLRLENAYRPLKNLQITAGLYFTQSKNIAGKSGYFDLSTNGNKLPVYTKLADANGDPLPVMKDYRQVYIDTAGAGKLLNWNYYPLDDYRHVSNTTTTQDILAKAGIEYKLFSWLSLNTIYQYEKQQVNGRILNDQQSYVARDLVNRFSQLNRTTGIVTYKIPNGAILDNSNSTLISHQARGQINFSKTWGSHSVNAVAGGELRKTDISGYSFRTYGYNDDILTSGNVDLTTIYPTFVTGGTQLIPNLNGFSGTMNCFVSMYANVAYSFRNKYTISGSGRRDASNLFGVNTNNKWTPLWSSGLAWNISDEPFYHFSTVPYLRVRATYGFSGNVDQSKSAVTVLSYSGTSVFTQAPIATVSRYNNPELRWEKIGELNIGLDFKSNNNRLLGSLEYFHKNGIDLYGNSPLDYTAGLGVSSIVKNVANMKGNGFDLELNCINIKKPMIWTTNLNFSYYRDVINNYYLTSKQGSNYISGSQPNISGIVGKPVYSIFSYKWAGLDPLTGDPQGYLNKQISKDYTNLVGKLTTVDSLMYNGPALPTFFGSFNNTFSLKGISLTASIVYKFDYFFRRESISYSSLFVARSGHSDFAKRWQNPGDELITNVPSMIYPAITNRDAFYSGSETLVEKGDNIRLQYILLSYELNKKQIRQLPFAKLQLYFNINNPGILWRANKLRIDPDYPSSVIPPSKSYSIGLRAIL
jgi:TonB-linked SusC/RagA family outer membrane protein